MTGKVDVEQNLVFRASEHTFQNTQGTEASGDYNTIHNNIFAYGRVGMIYEGGTTVQNYLTELISNNIFYFDRVYNSTCGIGQNTNQCSFYVQSGCTVLNSAPLVAQTWNPDLYWGHRDRIRRDILFARILHRFHRHVPEIHFLHVYRMARNRARSGRSGFSTRLSSIPPAPIPPLYCAQATARRIITPSLA